MKPQKIPDDIAKSLGMDTSKPDDAPKDVKKPNALKGPLKPPIIDALKFVKPLQSKRGEIFNTHVWINHGWLCSHHTAFTMGVEIDANLSTCPHYASLSEAINSYTDTLTLTQLNDTQLSVNTGQMQAIVPCHPSHFIDVPTPDENIAVIDDRIKDVFKECVKAVDEKHPRPELQGLLLQSQTCIGTDGKIYIEGWHGIDLPPNLVIPKKFAMIVMRTRKPLTGFGFSDKSVTFWFDDGSFIRTARFQVTFPVSNHLFDWVSETVQTPDKLIAGVKSVSQFNSEGFVHFKENGIVSHPQEESVTRFKIPHLSEGAGFDGFLIAKCEKFAEVFSIKPGNLPVIFFASSTFRAIIAGLKTEKTKVHNSALTEEQKKQNGEYYNPDDEIPF